MALQPVDRLSVPEAVFRQIVADVLSGEIAPGDALPSERRLAEVFNVSRPAVREALQRLSAIGLVDVRQGDVTTVNDFRRTAGLDLLPRLLINAGTLDVSVARSIVEARQHNGPEVASLAAQRNPHAELGPLVEAIEAEPDPVGRQRRVLDFWDRIIDAADSIVYRLMYNALRAAYEPALAALATVMTAETDHPQRYRDLAAAIAAGDPDRAHTAAEQLLAPSSQALLDVLESLRKSQ
jgi:DNA-binding FadR family transcriptional regulator